jgi:hypothetical protein
MRSSGDASLCCRAPRTWQDAQWEKRSRSVPMRELLVELGFLIPTSLAVLFMLWVFWNFCKQLYKR